MRGVSNAPLGARHHRYDINTTTVVAPPTTLFVFVAVGVRVRVLCTLVRTGIKMLNTVIFLSLVFCVLFVLCRRDPEGTGGSFEADQANAWLLQADR